MEFNCKNQDNNINNNKCTNTYLIHYGNPYNIYNTSDILCQECETNITKKSNKNNLSYYSVSVDKYICLNKNIKYSNNIAWKNQFGYMSNNINNNFHCQLCNFIY